jgi:3-oxoadipate enol-lactonase
MRSMGRRWDRGFVATEGEEIYWERIGEGPAIVLGHGAGGNHASWFQQVPALAERFTTVSWDQRGFGRSTNRGEAAGPAAAARDLIALLDHLDLPDAHLVGQSLGGWAVMIVALAEPARVRSLVLTDTVAGIFTPLIEQRFDTALAALRAAADTPPTVGQPGALAPRTWADAPRRSFLYQQIGSAGGQGPPDAIPQIRAYAQPAERLRDLALPVLFVVGEDDPVFPPEAIGDASAQLPDTRVAVVECAGHSAHYEQPDTWNELVLDFLANAAGVGQAASSTRYPGRQ